MAQGLSPAFVNTPPWRVVKTRVKRMSGVFTSS
jgi:hypothetical protein